jgi:hypothetical protein
LLGVILVILGVAFYLATDRVSMTALIPALFGVVFMILGLLAGKERLLKHAMHAAAALGALAFVFGAVRIVMVLALGKDIGLAFIETATLAVLCGVFVGLCVKSFVDARRRRSQQGGA